MTKEQILSDEKREAIYEAHKYEGPDGWEFNHDAIARAIEAAVIAELAERANPAAQEPKP